MMKSSKFQDDKVRCEWYVRESESEGLKVSQGVEPSNHERVAHVCPEFSGMHGAFEDIPFS